MRSKIDRRMTIKERVESNIVIWMLGILITGFLAGLGTYKGILKIANLTVVPKTEVSKKNPNEKEGGSVFIPRPDLATFGNEWPRTNKGIEWSIFSDSKFLGNSSVWYETYQHDKGSLPDESTNKNG